ncbi:hypothetical protein KVT40_001487 [Elsinoe batatas]|uniref:Uncharacterized protein n=1 Tax=Elsinoe batatas TaxID=2601811 RepID=A0A8K0L844_9PEZI|nr:hypothetical protein KVT40_001487 [Elsinoe batatas]
MGNGTRALWSRTDHRRPHIIAEWMKTSVVRIVENLDQNQDIRAMEIVSQYFPYHRVSLADIDILMSQRPQRRLCLPRPRPGEANNSTVVCDDYWKGYLVDLFCDLPDSVDAFRGELHDNESSTVTSSIRKRFRRERGVEKRYSVIKAGLEQTPCVWRITSTDRDNRPRTINLNLVLFNGHQEDSYACVDVSDESVADLVHALFPDNPIAMSEITDESVLDILRTKKFCFSSKYIRYISWDCIVRLDDESSRAVMRHIKDRVSHTIAGRLATIQQMNVDARWNNQSRACHEEYMTAQVAPTSVELSYGYTECIAYQPYHHGLMQSPFSGSFWKDSMENAQQRYLEILNRELGLQLNHSLEAARQQTTEEQSIRLFVPGSSFIDNTPSVPATDHLPLLWQDYTQAWDARLGGFVPGEGGIDMFVLSQYASQQ